MATLGDLTTAELGSIADFDIVQEIENVCGPLSRDRVANDAQAERRADRIDRLRTMAKVINAVWGSGIVAADEILNP